MTGPGGTSDPDRPGGDDRLHGVDEHLDGILSTLHRAEPVEFTLLDAHGLVCAEAVTARTPLPVFDNSAMDGYAVRALDVAGASADSPAILPVDGDVAAGSEATLAVEPGRCTRIMTGAPIPAGADAVVPVEWTDGGVSRVEIRRPALAGSYVRRTGEDIAAGAVAVEAGMAIGPAQVAVLAAVGRDRVRARRRPRVVVLSTGSELVEVGDALGAGQIVDANGHLLTAAARDAGAQARRAGIVPDDRQRVLDALAEHVSEADLLITSGGVSMGAYDVVKEALAELGTVRFSRVAMQPGMPQGFGTLGPDRVPVFCLPGNPVSALVSFEVFVRPAIRYLLGASQPRRRTLTASLAEPLSSPPGRRQYRRGRLRQSGGGLTVELVGGPGSHLLANLARSDCIIVIDEDVTEVRAGSQVSVLPLSTSGGGAG